MRRVVAILLTIIAASSCSHKLPLAYRENIKQAQKFHSKKQYEKSAAFYSKAFESNYWKGLPNDRYNAARSWAMADKIDSAFSQLFKIARKAHYSKYERINHDKEFVVLKKDERWMKLIEEMKQNREKKRDKSNKLLKAELRTIDRDDQKDRIKLGKIEKKYGWDSKEVKDRWKIIIYKDSINLIKVQNIIDKYGWLGPDRVGRWGNGTLFLVIQHADLKIQEKYLPIMREAVNAGNANPADLALLEDRVALGQGKKQIYGSQIGMDMENKTYFLEPLEDPDNVDKRRAAVGLQPLAKYLGYWKMEWNIDKYKKQLPELEKKIKR